MKKAISLILFGALIFTLAVPYVGAQDAGAILEKMFKAQGGKEFLKSLKTATMSGTMELVQQGLEGTITVYTKDPEKTRVDIEIMGMLITQAYDGETAWFTNPQTGAVEEMSEPLAIQMRREAIGYNAYLYPEKYGITFTYKSKETIEGKNFHVLEMKYPDDFKILIYVDTETYLDYKTLATIVDETGVEVEMETYSMDYKKVDGMTFAHTIVTYKDGEEFMAMTITDVKFNTEIDDSLFEMEK